MKREQKRFLAALFVLALSFAAVCMIGRYPISPAALLRFLGGEKSTAASVFFRIRLPRAVFSALCGMSLALSGYAYQELFQNPLASPDVLGASGGAAVGATAVLLAGGGMAAIWGASLIGAFAAVGLALLLSRLFGRAQTVTLILAGIVIKALADSLLMVFKYTADTGGTLAAIEYRLMGTLQTVRAAHLLPTALLALPPLVLLYLLRWRIQILSLGEGEAHSLGITPWAFRAVCLALATIPAAAAVAVTGVVSWVGLIVPHAVRLFAGGSFKENFGFCGVCGAIFLLWIDTAARSLTAAEIPLSILTSFAGALFLMLFLALRRCKA